MSSTKFTVPKGVKKIDVFCVGGGGSGGNSNAVSAGFGVNARKYLGGGGGGGGYTNTMKNVAVTPGQQLSVVVGNGGSGGTNSSGGHDGGKSSVGDICSAFGGLEGGGYISTGKYGGSGGGADADYISYDNGSEYNYGWKGNIGGKDGRNGEDGVLVRTSDSDTPKTIGGKGQGTTTRYFGESTGTLYSAGGCGLLSPSNYGTSFPTYAVANTGNGGDGGSVCNPYYGSSGICIIRWGK